MLVAGRCSAGGNNERNNCVSAYVYPMCIVEFDVHDNRFLPAPIIIVG